MKFIQLICLIAEVMNLIRYVILLSTGTLYSCVFLYLIQLVSNESCTVCNTVTYGYIMTAYSFIFGSHKFCNNVMYGHIM